jgi:nucleotide-binding universal stress UspA family protein
MFEKVLFPVIMSEYTEQMLDCLGGLSNNGVKEVLLFHVLGVSEMVNGTVSRKYDEDILIKWKSSLEESGVNVDYQIVTGIPWIEIVDIAEKGSYSFIMIGSHGSNILDKMFLGSVTQNVVHHSSKPIFIFRFRENFKKSVAPFCQDIFGKILYATDFSESSKKCIPYIDKMVNKTSQSLIILHVQDLRNLKHVPPEQIEEFNRIDLERLEELKVHFEKAGYGRVMTLLSTGYSIPEILNYIRSEEPTILVIGKKGKSNIREMLLGGVAETMIHKSGIPVFIVEGNK